MTVALAPDYFPSPSITGATAVRPAAHPAPSLTRLIAASIILGVPSGVAIFGSAAGLTAIAAEDGVAAPATLPFCLDVLALGVVVVAMMFPDVAGRVTWKLTPWVCYLGSAVLQVSEAWDGGPRAWGTHAAGLAAAAVGSHFILNLWERRAHAGAGHTETAPAEVEPEPVAPSKPQSGAVVAFTKPHTTTARAARPSRRPTTAATKTADAPDAEVIELISAALDAMGVTAHDTNRNDVLDHLRATKVRKANGKAIHATEVGPALKHLREQDQ